MRDILVTLIFAYVAIHVVTRPYIGVYLWNWFAFMNPHRLTWGFAYNLPFAQMAAIVTLIGLIFGKYEKNKLWHAETKVIAILMVWVTLNTFLFAFNYSAAFAQWEKFLKIQVFIFLAVLLITDRQKLDMFIWVMVLSIGFFGVKGGIFTVMTGGGERVWGPPGSSIAGNNELALALLMIVPLIRYLYLQQSNRWIRWGLAIAFLLCMISIVGTQSRGALLGIIAIGSFLVLKSRNKVGIGLAVAAIVALVLLFMPDKWWDRMRTIENYEQDESALSRINAWWVGWNVATDTFVGGGPGMWNRHVYAKYAPDPTVVFDVHSIYFEMLGEQGFPGLFLFLLLGWLFWRRCSSLIRRFKNDPEKKWASDLGAMLQVSFIGYAVCGAFLGLAYFDLYYNLVITGLLASIVVEKAVDQPVADKEGDKATAKAA